MSFFYKYVDPAQIAQSDQSDEDASGGGGGSDESSALILDKSVGAESEQTIPSGGSDLDLDFGTTSEFWEWSFRVLSCDYIPLCTCKVCEFL